MKPVLEEVLHIIHTLSRNDGDYSLKKIGWHLCITDSDFSDALILGDTMIIRIGRLLCYSIICILLLSSCRRPTSADTYPEIVFPDRYVEGQDFNPMAFGERPNTAAVTEDGIYFKVGSFLFFADIKTLKARPLCYKLTCTHINERPEKIIECNAFSDPFYREKDFLGVFRDHVYFTALDCTTGLTALVRTNLDGSGRETVIQDVRKITASSMRIHRGVLYYHVSMTDLDGNVRYLFCGIDLTKDKSDPEILFEGSTVAGSFTEVLPYGNYIYYNEKFVIGEKGNKRQKNRISRYHIINRTCEVLTDISEYNLYGVVDQSLILFDGSNYYEMDQETNEIRISELCIQKYAEGHPDWECYAHSITRDIAFLYCEDHVPDETSIIWNRIIVNSQGEEVIREFQPNVIMPEVSDQIITINGDRYYLWYSASIRPYTVSLYKVEDLLEGKLDPIEMLKVLDKNELNAEYTYTIKN